MFDFEYNTNVGFVPRISVLVAMNKAAEEEIEGVKEEVVGLSENVSENSEAIADNKDAIANNTEAIENEVIAREEAVDALNERIDNIPTFKLKVVDVLPEEGDPSIIYLVKDEGKDTYSEFVYADGKWEKLGSEVDLSDYITREEFENELGAKADIADVYSKAEADALFITEHQDISYLATKDELANGLANEASAREEAIGDINETINNVSGAVDDFSYEFESVNEKLAGLAEVNVAQNEKIATLTTDYKKLKEIVGDIGGNVEYDVPGDGKLTDVLKKSGTVKLMEDTESATYAGGLTSKNVTTLNTNGKTVTFTGTTVNNPGIMTRGSEQLTIVGKGTIDGNGRIAVEANGANSIINLSGSTGFFGAEPTYVTDRSGGELIYCYLGTINIYAGIFKNNGENKGFTLNCYDANYRSGKANIIVMGGKFYDFDPANNAAEGEGTSFVPEGYESVHTTEEIEGVIHDVYTVKKSA